MEYGHALKAQVGGGHVFNNVAPCPKTHKVIIQLFLPLTHHQFLGAKAPLEIAQWYLTEPSSHPLTEPSSHSHYRYLITPSKTGHSIKTKVVKYV